MSTCAQNVGKNDAGAFTGSLANKNMKKSQRLPKTEEGELSRMLAMIRCASFVSESVTQVSGLRPTC